MSKIADFKSRRALRKLPSINEKTAMPEVKTPAPKNEALMLLAKLLNVAEVNAIAEANKYVENNIRFFEELQIDDEGKIIGFDLAKGEDKTVVSEVKLDDKGDISSITEKTPVAVSVDQLTEQLDSTASSVDSAADNVNDASSNLAYNADEIAAATNDIKEATAELKKPSAVQKSLGSKKTTARKTNSKK